MAERTAITPGGEIKPAADFTAKEKWWCDGEDCGGCGVSGPHVHPYDSISIAGGALPVDPLTGRTVTDPSPEPDSS